MCLRQSGGMGLIGICCCLDMWRPWWSVCAYEWSLCGEYQRKTVSRGARPTRTESSSPRSTVPPLFIDTEYRRVFVQQEVDECLRRAHAQIQHRLQLQKVAAVEVSTSVIPLMDTRWCFQQSSILFSRTHSSLFCLIWTL